jgi:hypothetical protein
VALLFADPGLSAEAAATHEVPELCAGEAADALNAVAALFAAFSGCLPFNVLEFACGRLLPGGEFGGALNRELAALPELQSLPAEPTAIVALLTPNLERQPLIGAFPFVFARAWRSKASEDVEQLLRFLPKARLGFAPVKSLLAKGIDFEPLPWRMTPSRLDASLPSAPFRTSNAPATHPAARQFIGDGPDCSPAHRSIRHFRRPPRWAGWRLQSKLKTIRKPISWDRQAARFERQQRGCNIPDDCGSCEAAEDAGVLQTVLRGGGNRARDERPQQEVR